MAGYDINDILRLAHEIRTFVAKGGFEHRFATMAKLYFEFADIGAMHGMQMQLLRALDPITRFSMDHIDCSRRIDDETIEIEIGGISVILTCKQRFAAQSGRAVGYNDIQFQQLFLPELPRLRNSST